MLFSLLIFVGVGCGVFGELLDGQIAPSSCGPSTPYQIAIRCDSMPKKKTGSLWTETDGVGTGCTELVKHCNELYKKDCFTQAVFNGRRYDMGEFCEFADAPPDKCTDSALIGVPTYACLGCPDPRTQGNIPACVEPLPSECATFPHMIAMFCGKVNRHLEDGRWVTDKDGHSGCTVKGADYCNHVYNDDCHYDTIEAGQEFIDHWCEAGNRNCNYAPRVTDVYVCPLSNSCERPPACKNLAPQATEPPLVDPGIINRCPNDCHRHGKCVQDPNNPMDYSCQCEAPYKGDDCGSLSAEFSKCFELPIPDDGSDSNPLLKELKNVCVEVSVAECEVEFKVKVGPLPFVRQFSVADFRSFLSKQGVGAVPPGVCLPSELTQIVGGCNVCANFTNIQITDTSLTGCGKLHAECNKIPLPVHDFNLGCFPDNAVVPACFSNCGGSKCSGHGTCVNGLNCECDKGYGGLDCNWDCPENCNDDQLWGYCTKDGCKCNGGRSGPSCGLINQPGVPRPPFHVGPGGAPTPNSNGGPSPSGTGSVLAIVALVFLAVLAVSGGAFYFIRRRRANKPIPYSSMGASLMLDDDSD